MFAAVVFDSEHWPSGHSRAGLRAHQLEWVAQRRFRQVYLLFGLLGLVQPGTLRLEVIYLLELAEARMNCTERLAADCQDQELGKLALGNLAIPDYVSTTILTAFSLGCI